MKLTTNQIRKIVNDSKQNSIENKGSLGFCRLHALPKNVRLHLYLEHTKQTSSTDIAQFHQILKRNLESYSDYDFVVWLTEL